MWEWNVPKDKSSPTESIITHRKRDPCSILWSRGGTTLTGPGRPSTQPGPAAIRGVGFTPCVAAALLTLSLFFVFLICFY